MDKRRSADALIQFLNSAPTPFHSFAALARMLEDAGARRLEERDPWQLERGGLIISSRTPRCSARFMSVRRTWQRPASIWRAHHDSPGLRIKPNGSRLDLTFER
jgi:aspartyl aminopeptidase